MSPFPPLSPFPPRHSLLLRHYNPRRQPTASACSRALFGLPLVLADGLVQESSDELERDVISLLIVVDVRQGILERTLHAHPRDAFFALDAVEQRRVAR